MRRRAQLYLDEKQYRWLKREVGPKGSIAGVVRHLIDRARSRRPRLEDDPFIKYLLSPPVEGVARAPRPSTTTFTVSEGLR